LGKGSCGYLMIIIIYSSSHIEIARFAGNFYRMLGKSLRDLPGATSGLIPPASGGDN